jgi:hypothetical protein
MSVFTPTPNRAQEPVFLTPGRFFTLHLKPNSETKEDGSNVRSAGDTRSVDLNKSRTVLLAKAVKWRATEEVVIEFNRDTSTLEPPQKFFVDNHGEFNVSTEIQRVSFSPVKGSRHASLYLEIA